MKTVQLMLGWALFLATASTQAITFSVIYTGDNDVDPDGTIIAAAGDLLTFDVILDFAPRLTIGGGFDINWDENAFSLVSFDFTQFGDPSLNRPPDIEPGRLFGAAIADFDNPFDFAYVGPVAFTFMPPDGATAGDVFSITPSATTAFDGGWLDPFIGPPIFPEYIGVDVRVVPVPAAFWLLATAVAVLPALGRRLRVQIA